MKDSVSLRDVYEIVERLENKMDTRMRDNEKRIDVIENNQSKAIGVISVISLFISGLLTFLWDRILGRSS